MVDSPFTSSLAALSRFFVGGGTVSETLQRVADLTLEAAPAADLVGVTMLVEGRPRTAIFTDETALQVDQAQYDSGDGPCLTAFRERRIVSLESTAETSDWPEFCRTAVANGIGSTLSFPLLVDKSSVGAMNLYAYPERAFGEEDHGNGELFAAQAAIVLANAQAYWDAQELSVGLGEAMRSRAVIEQAKGMLMAAQAIDEDEAFQVLVRASQRENERVRDIARRIVDDAVAGRQPPTVGGSEPGQP